MPENSKLIVNGSVSLAQRPKGRNEWEVYHCSAPGLEFDLTRGYGQPSTNTHFSHTVPGKSL